MLLLRPVLPSLSSAIALTRNKSRLHTEAYSYAQVTKPFEIGQWNFRRATPRPVTPALLVTYSSATPKFAVPPCVPLTLPGLLPDANFRSPAQRVSPYTAPRRPLGSWPRSAGWPWVSSTRLWLAICPTARRPWAQSALGSGIFTVLGWFGGGVLLGLDTLVSQAFGAGKREDCHRSLVQGIYLSLALTPLLSAPVLLLPALLRSMQVDIAMLALAIPYFNALIVGLLPLLLYFAVPSLSSGDEHGQTCCLRPCHRQHHQRPLQLDSDLWALGRARNGNGRFRLVHSDCARLHGCRLGRLFVVVRPQTSH